MAFLIHTTTAFKKAKMGAIQPPAGEEEPLNNSSVT